MIADEILCGSGRTGKFFACEHDGIKPDLLLLGKGLSSGYIALSSLTVRASHLREMKSGTGYFMHAQTFLQAPSQCSAGLATLDYFERTNAVSNAARVGEILHQLLRDEISPLPGVGFVTGKGMLAGVEFVEDKASKRAFDRSKKIAEGFIAHAFAQGLVLWPNVGQADGVNGDLVVFGPPLTTTETQAREIVGALKKAITTFFKK